MRRISTYLRPNVYTQNETMKLIFYIFRKQKSCFLVYESTFCGWQPASFDDRRELFLNSAFRTFPAFNVYPLYVFVRLNIMLLFIAKVDSDPRAGNDDTKILDIEILPTALQNNLLNLDFRLFRVFLQIC